MPSKEEADRISYYRPIATGAFKTLSRGITTAKFARIMAYTTRERSMIELVWKLSRMPALNENSKGLRVAVVTVKDGAISVPSSLSLATTIGLSVSFCVYEYVQ